MLSFKSFIAESGDSSFEFHKDHDNSDPTIHNYKFETDKGKKFNALVYHHSHGGGADVEFTDSNNDIRQNHQHPKDAIKVISTVHKIMKHHAENHPNIRHFHFTSDKTEPSRDSLYSKMTKKLGGESYGDDDGSDTYHTIPADNL